MENLDWTAIAIAVLTVVLTGAGWIFRRSFTKLDRHMEKVELFMVDAGKNDVAVAAELKHHAEKFSHVQRWLENHEQRLNTNQVTSEIHEMVSDLHGGGCWEKPAA